MWPLEAYSEWDEPLDLSGIPLPLQTCKLTVAPALVGHDAAEYGDGFILEHASGLVRQRSHGR